MSDLTWTEMPEVNPEQPDELVLDFSGEIHRIAPPTPSSSAGAATWTSMTTPTFTVASWSSPSRRSSGGSPTREVGCRPR